MTSAADIYARLCNEDDQLPDVFEFISNQQDLADQETVNILLVDQFQRWKRQQAIPVDHYFERTPNIEDTLKVDLLIEEYGYLEQRGVAPSAEEFVRRYQFLSTDALESICDSLDIDWDDESGPSSNSTGKGSRNSELPSTIGRYQVVRSIGKGAFGEVFLAKDPELQRSVAVKVPTAERIRMGGGSDEFLNEARAVAGLDHPNIVPVYDVGQTEDGRCFVVSKYIKGNELRKEIRKGFEYDESARIVSLLAEALHVAHQADIVHRDVKPGNIIVDQQRMPHLLDFGLSIRADQRHDSSNLAGTPAYMSPEQASGKTQNIDGRSDIYSLGVVFYELLTGKRPYQGDDPAEIIQLVQTADVRPPRQINDRIPPALERICMTALSRKVSERFNTAKDFASELQLFLSDEEKLDTSPLSSKSNSHYSPATASSNSIRFLFVVSAISAAVVLLVAAFQFGMFNRAGNEVDSSLENSTNLTSKDRKITVENPGLLSVLGFRNVAADESTDWIGVGLTAVLRSELEKSDDLVVTSMEQVQELRADLEIVDVESLGSSALSRIRRRQGTEYVVSGSFAPSGAEFNELKLHITVQDTGNNQIISDFSQLVSLESWWEKLPEMAARIRKEMSLLPIDLMKAGQMAVGKPSAEEPTRLYFEGMAAKLAGAEELATDKMLAAEKMEPESVVVHDALANLYTNVGDDKRALDHARRAFELSPNSPPKLRQQISSRFHLLNGEPSKSVAVRHEIFESQQSVEAGIQLGQAMIAAGQSNDAIKLATRLTEKPQSDSELARLNLMVADAAQSISDFALQISAATKAEESAKMAASNLLQARALLSWGLGLQRLGKNSDAVSKLSQSFEFYNHLNDVVGAGKAKAALSKVYVDQGELDSAETTLDEALQFANQSRNQRLQTQLLGQQGELLIYRGKFGEAAEKLEQARARFVELGDKGNMAGMSLTLANVVARQGDFERARELIVEARTAFQSVGNRQGQARTWGQQGAIYGRSGESIQAKQHFERALELFREVGDRIGEATCLGDLGNVYSSSGDFEKASQFMSQSLEIHRQIESRHGSSTVKYNLAVLYFRTGKTRAGLALLTDALETFKKQGNHMNACFVQRKMGDVLLQLGQTEESLKTLEGSLEFARKVGSKAVEAHSLSSLGLVHYQKGNLKKGIELLEQSNEIRRALNQDGNVAANNLQLALIAIREQRLQDAEELVQSAEETLSLNNQGYFWIQQLIKARLLAEKSEMESRKILKKFNQFMDQRKSQDVEIGLQLMHQHANLLANLGDRQAAEQAFENVIQVAQSQSNVRTELLARNEQIQFKSQGDAPVTIQEVNETIAAAQKVGFTDIVRQLKSLQ